MAPSGRHRCTTCDQNFGRRGSLQRHVDTVHSLTPAFTCTIEGCHTKFKRRYDRIRHEKTIHGFSKEVCDHCGAFVRHDGLRQHKAGPTCREETRILRQAYTIHSDSIEIAGVYSSPSDSFTESSVAGSPSEASTLPSDHGSDFIGIQAVHSESLRDPFPFENHCVPNFEVDNTALPVVAEMTSADFARQIPVNPGPDSRYGPRMASNEDLGPLAHVGSNSDPPVIQPTHFIDPALLEVKDGAPTYDHEYNPIVPTFADVARRDYSPLPYTEPPVLSREYPGCPPAAPGYFVNPPQVPRASEIPRLSGARNGSDSATHQPMDPSPEVAEQWSSDAPRNARRRRSPRGVPVDMPYEGYILERQDPYPGERSTWARVGRRNLELSEEQLQNIVNVHRQKTRKAGKTPQNDSLTPSSNQQGIVNRLLAQQQRSERDKEFIMEAHCQPRETPQQGHPNELYRPLDSSQKQIRHLKLCEDSNGTSVRGEWAIVSPPLKRWPSYEAVSYRWGQATSSSVSGFNGLHDLERHIHRNHAEKNLLSSCPRHGCSRTFARVAELKDHVRTAHQPTHERRWGCRRNQDNATLMEEDRLKTTKHKGLLCPEPTCRDIKQFRSRFELEQHKKTKHYGESAVEDRHLFQCAISGCSGGKEVWLRANKFLDHVRQDHPTIDAEQHILASQNRLRCENAFDEFSIKLQPVCQQDRPALRRSDVSALSMAAEAGQSDLVRRLLEVSADHDFRSAPPRSPLHVACDRSHLRIVNGLLRRGAAQYDSFVDPDIEHFDSTSLRPESNVRRQHDRLLGHYPGFMDSTVTGESIVAMAGRLCSKLREAPELRRRVEEDLSKLHSLLDGLRTDLAAEDRLQQESGRNWSFLRLGRRRLPVRMHGSDGISRSRTKSVILTGGLGSTAYLRMALQGSVEHNIDCDGIQASLNRNESRYSESSSQVYRLSRRDWERCEDARSSSRLRGAGPFSSTRSYMSTSGRGSHWYASPFSELPEEGRGSSYFAIVLGFIAAVMAILHLLLDCRTFKSVARHADNSHRQGAMTLGGTYSFIKRYNNLRMAKTEHSWISREFIRWTL